MQNFPLSFLWGAATAAAQIEGAGHLDGKTDSVWDAFARVPGAVAGGDNLERAVDHYHRYPEDVAILKELGLDAYRFSTSWSRVHPDGGAVNPAGVAFYDRLVDELLGAGIDPWLTCTTGTCRRPSRSPAAGPIARPPSASSSTSRASTTPWAIA